ncbi:MAG: tetratricopeptide repeat protein [Rhodanobacteraceae bacterium]
MKEQEGRPRVPSEPAIRAQLEKIMGEAPFASSPVLSRFLRHVVEHALDGGGAPLKEFAIGVEVFDRNADYDPRIDTIVRVQARRLRAALEAYYQGAGRQDPIRIEMPKGQYGARARFAEAARDGLTVPHVVTDDVQRRPIRSIQPAALFDQETLPVPRNPLIGRERELKTIGQRLRSEAVRLLTLTGIGGSGKTRLALELARDLRDVFPGGVLFLDLAGVTDRPTLIAIVADVLGVKRTEGRPLTEAIADRVRAAVIVPTLIVLDNFEGVIDSGDIVGVLLDVSAALSILVTSRVALQLYGEHEFPLAPLAVPESADRDDPAALAKVSSVRLFLDRASAVQPHWQLDPDQADALTELCIRLDGLPLAIELVAAQAKAMTPQQMLERFTGHLDLPPNPARDAPSRQRTLRRVIDWSFDLLDEQGRRALRRLSVFAGGFTLEAAEAVADATGDLGVDLETAINALVAMGLVYFRNEGEEPRFAMLETLRAYGRERLNASGETETVHKAHAAYCLVLAEEGVGTLDIAQHQRWLARCEREQDNFRQALGHLLRYGPHRWALRLGHALFIYWERTEKIIEAHRLLNAIINTVPVETDMALWAKVGMFAATVAAFHGDPGESDAGFTHILELYRKLGDPRGEASALNALGVNARLRGDESAARGWLHQSLEVCRKIGNRSEIAGALSNVAGCDLRLGNTEGVQELLTEAHGLFIAENDPGSAAWCINHLGDLARAEGDYARAADQYRCAEAQFRQLGDGWGLARSLADRGQLAVDAGEYVEARPLLLQALAGFQALNHQRGMATVVDSIACLALGVDRPEMVIKLLGAAESWRRAVGFSPRRDDIRQAEQMREQARSRLDSAVFKALHDAGQKMSSTDVAACVEVLLEAAGD